MLLDALDIWNYFTQERPIDSQSKRSSKYELETQALPPSQIILFGRSIGSGIATELASYACYTLKTPPCMLLLVSPFLSIRKLVTDLFGVIAGLIIRDRYTNDQTITTVTCPTLIIHGKMDPLVPWQHSRTLFNLSPGPSSLMLSKHMTHDHMDLLEDLIHPLSYFLIQLDSKEQ
jgi:pimeloyl-ACP methyl ester carboxylesterase